MLIKQTIFLLSFALVDAPKAFSIGTNIACEITRFSRDTTFIQKWKSSYEAILNQPLGKRFNFFFKNAAMQTRRDAILDAARRGLRQIETLQKLGFKIDRSIEIPHLSDLYLHYEQAIEEHKKSGLKEEDVIRPGRVFQDSTGRYHFVDYRSMAKAEWHQVDMVFLPAKVVGDMLAEGYFPVSNSDRVHHDLAHLTGFIENPHYMAALRNLARYYTTASPDSRPSSRDMYHRMFFFLEGFSWVPSDRQAALQNLLAEPFKKEGESVNLDALINYFKTKDEAWTKRHLDTLLNNIDNIVEDLGGGPREIGVASYSDTEIAEGLRSLILTAQVQRQYYLDGKSGKDTVIYVLAKLEIYLWESSQIDPATFARELQKKSLDMLSPLARLFLSSGALKKELEFLPDGCMVQSVKNNLIGSGLN